jgi:thioredoxin-related protein
MQTEPPKPAACVAAAAMMLCFCFAADAAEPVEWLTDLDQAKLIAARSGKDLLINFTGQAWCGACMELEREVLTTEEFASMAADFVLVRLDYPPGDDGVIVDRLPQEPPPPHIAWRKIYDVSSFPTVFFADAAGRPYAVTGNIDLGPKEYVKHLNELRKIHARRDSEFAAADKAKGIERAKSLAAALMALEGGSEYARKESLNDPVVLFYRNEIDAVIRLDSDNAAGLCARVSDILHKEELRAEDQAFYDRLRKADKKHKGTDEALQLLDKRIATINSPILRNRARRARLVSLEWGKRNEEALAYARELAADESYSLDDRHWLRTRVAYNLWRLHRDDEAIAVYEKLILEVEDHPRQAFVYLWDKADVFRYAGRNAEALEAWNAAVKLVNPDTVDWRAAQSWRANLLERLGRVGEACAVYKVLIESRISTPIERASCFAGMAVLLDKQGSRAAALDAAAQAQQILNSKATSADAASVAQVQTLVDKVNGSTATEPSDVKHARKD